MNRSNSVTWVMYVTVALIFIIRRILKSFECFNICRFVFPLALGLNYTQVTGTVRNPCRCPKSGQIWYLPVCTSLRDATYLTVSISGTVLKCVCAGGGGRDEGVSRMFGRVQPGPVPQPQVRYGTSTNTNLRFSALTIPQLYFTRYRYRHGT